MTALFSLQNGAHLQPSASLLALFLREHSFSAPEGAERQWTAPGEDSWIGQTWRDPLWNFKQKMALTWDHHHKFTVVHRQHYSTRTKIQYYYQNSII